MPISIAIVTGLALGVLVLAAAFEVANEFELNLFHIGDT